MQTARATEPAAPAAGGAGGEKEPKAAQPSEEPQGTLATDEALAALKEKLAGGKS